MATGENQTGKTRGPYNKGERIHLYEKARELRKLGYGYKSIEREIGISHGTIRHWVRDIPVEKKVALKLSIITKEKPIEKLKAKSAIRKRLIQIRGHRCENCKFSTWLGKPIMLELHRIISKRPYTEIENNLLLCPNCHSQTGTWRKKS